MPANLLLRSVVFFLRLRVRVEDVVDSVSLVLLVLLIGTENKLSSEVLLDVKLVKELVEVEAVTRRVKDSVLSLSRRICFVLMSAFSSQSSLPTLMGMIGLMSSGGVRLPTRRSCLPEEVEELVDSAALAGRDMRLKFLRLECDRSGRWRGAMCMTESCMKSKSTSNGVPTRGVSSCGVLARSAMSAILFSRQFYVYPM